MNDKNKKKTPTTQLTVLIPTADKTLLQEAAQASGSRSLSDFVRDVALNEACKVLAKEPVNPARAVSSPKSICTLHAYIVPSLSDDATQPAIAFPSIQNFATVFSDRNRAVLRYIAGNAPHSITELAEEIGYPYRGLHQSLSTLAGYGVTAYHGSASGGQHLTPYLLCDRVRLTVPFSGKGVDNGLYVSIGICSADDEPLSGKPDKVLDSVGEFSRALPAHALRILQVIAQEKPATIEELAVETGLSVENLYGKLKALKSLGLVTMIGRHPIKPVLACDGLSVELVFRAGSNKQHPEIP